VRTPGEDKEARRLEYVCVLRTPIFLAESSGNTAEAHGDATSSLSLIPHAIGVANLI